MGKVSIFQVKLGKQDAIYRAGERLSGVVFAQFPAVTHISQLYVHIKGEAQTSWLNQKTENTLTYHQVFVDRLVDLPFHQSGNDELQAGEYNFPFSFDLPVNLPSSVEGEYGSIRYSCRAVLELEATSGIVCTLLGLQQTNSFNSSIPFKIFAVHDLSLDSLNARPVISEDVEIFRTCCCIRTGQIRAKISFPKLGFALYEPILLYAVVNNESRHRISYITIRVLQHMRFFGQSEFLLTDEIKEVRTLVGGKQLAGVAPRTSKKWEAEVIPLYSDREVLPTQRNCTVDMEYTLRFEIDGGPQLELPIVFGTKAANLP